MSSTLYNREWENNGIRKKQFPVSTEFAKFLAEQIDRLKKAKVLKEASARAFAALIGTSHTTVSVHLRGDAPYGPSVTFMRALSKATGVPLAEIEALAFPEMRDELGVEIPPRILELAKRLAKLSEGEIDLIFRLALAMEDEDAPDE